VTARIRTQIAALFATLPLLGPGPVQVTSWRSDISDSQPSPADLCAGSAHPSRTPMTPMRAELPRITPEEVSRAVLVGQDGCRPAVLTCPVASPDWQVMGGDHPQPVDAPVESRGLAGRQAHVHGRVESELALCRDDDGVPLVRPGRGEPFQDRVPVPDYRSRCAAAWLACTDAATARALVWPSQGGGYRHRPRQQAARRTACFAQILSAYLHRCGDVKWFAVARLRSGTCFTVLPCPDCCRFLRAGGRVRGRGAPAQRRRRRP
jgi:hypothetical protein